MHANALSDGFLPQFTGPLQEKQTFVAKKDAVGPASRGNKTAESDAAHAARTALYAAAQGASK